MDKHDAPLLLISANRGEVRGRTRMQKLMFLLQESDGTDRLPHFDYMAWDYGPYSKELQVCLNDLVVADFIQEEPHEVKDGHMIFTYTLRPAGKKRLKRVLEQTKGQAANDFVREITTKWGNASLDKLIAHVYASHPEYTSRSKLL